MEGTGLSSGEIARGGTIDHYVADGSKNWILATGTASNITAATGAGYAYGCLALASDTGILYYNTGGTTTASWTAVNAGAAALTIPSSFTDSTTTNGNSFRILTTAGTFTTGGAAIKADLAAGTAGNGLVAITTGVYTGTGLLLVSGTAATTGVLAQITGTGLTTGYGVEITTGTALTTGANLYVNMGAATAGNGIYVATTGVYLTGSSGLVNVTANAATTTTGLVQISGTGLTSGVGLLVTGGGANMTSTGMVESIVMGAATTGHGLTISTTGVYAGGYVLGVSAASATTGTLQQIIGTGLTTGIGLQVGATAATLTTGRYVSMYDGATEVFGIGTNGHIISTVSAAAPSIAVTTQDGITAAALGTGASDTCGTITTTGTSTGGTVITVTFGKTYTNAPKGIQLEALNAAGGGVNTPPYVSSLSATAFAITIPASGTYAATPSWSYLVVA